MFPRRFITLFAALVAIVLSASAHAQGFYAGPNGTGYFCQTNSTGRSFCAQYSYRSSVGGSAEWFATSTTDQDSTHISGTLFQGSGGQTLGGTYRSPLITTGTTALRLTFADPVNGTAQLGSNMAVSIARLTLEAGRPVGAFNTIRTGWYVDPNALGTGWSFEVQGSTLFGAVFTYAADGSAIWNTFTGALILNTSNATSTFSGQLQSCTSGPVCANAGAITIQFRTNTSAVVTLANGAVVNLSPYSF